MDPEGWLNAELQRDRANGDNRSNDHDQEGGRAIADIELTEIQLAASAFTRKANGARE
jgi:hypothetical protein